MNNEHDINILCSAEYAAALNKAIEEDVERNNPIFKERIPKTNKLVYKPRTPGLSELPSKVKFLTQKEHQQVEALKKQVELTPAERVAQAKAAQEAYHARQVAFRARAFEVQRMVYWCGDTHWHQFIVKTV